MTENYQDLVQKVYFYTENKNFIKIEILPNPKLLLLEPQ